jgi:hypothetical protein
MQGQTKKYTFFCLLVFGKRKRKIFYGWRSAPLAALETSL